MPELAPGLEGHFEFTVEEKHLASHVGSGLVDVFSTAMMIGGMEEAAVLAIQPYLPEGKTSVGVFVEVTHKAATPTGMRARFIAKLLEISSNGKGFRFHVEAWDEKEMIGEGTHQRVLVDQKKFEEKTRAKLNNT